MFNNFLMLSPFIYGLSIIFAVFLARLKAFKYLLFPIYIVSIYFLLDTFYKGKISEEEFLAYLFLISNLYIIYALFRLLIKMNIIKILIISIPALVLVFEIYFKIDIYYLLISFYISSSVCILCFVIYVFRKIKEKDRKWIDL